MKYKINDQVIFWVNPLDKTALVGTVKSWEYVNDDYKNGIVYMLKQDGCTYPVIEGNICGIIEVADELEVNRPE